MAERKPLDFTAPELFWTLCAVLLLGALLGWGLWSDPSLANRALSSNAFAAWVQAVGSIGAILVAVRVADRQGQQTQQIARDSHELQEKLVDREKRTIEELKDLRKQRSAIWIGMNLKDLIEESDRIATLHEEFEVPALSEFLTGPDRSEVLSHLTVSRFAHADGVNGLLQHLDDLSIPASHDVMHVLRVQGHYRASLETLHRFVESGGALYRTVHAGLNLRRLEAIRVREHAKTAYDRLSGEVPALVSRSEVFAGTSNERLTGPVVTPE